MPPRCAVIVIAAALLAGGCAGFGSDARPPARERSGSPAPVGPSGPLRVAGAGEIDAPHVTANRAYGLPDTGGPRRLAAAVNASLAGTLAPAAVPRPGDGRVVAYQAFLDGRPVLRRYDAGRRRDVVIARGAFSIAWRRDGALAYFKGLRSRVRDPSRHQGHLIVRHGGRSERWTPEPGRYVAAAWAGSRLLAYRLARLSGDVLAFDGPRRARVLARNSFLVAVSPDGRRAFVSGVETSGPTVRVVDVATGASAADLSLRRDEAADAAPPTTFVGPGSWFGDRVVGATNFGLLVFRVGSSRIALEQRLDADPALFPTSLQEARADASGRRIVAWAELAAKPRQAVPEAALVDCDRLTLHCRQGPPAPSLEPPRPIYNPSRP